MLFSIFPYFMTFRRSVPNCGFSLYRFAKQWNWVNRPSVLVLLHIFRILSKKKHSIHALVVCVRRRWLYSILWFLFIVQFLIKIHQCPTQSVLCPQLFKNSICALDGTFSKRESFRWPIKNYSRRIMTMATQNRTGNLFFFFVSPFLSFIYSHFACHRAIYINHTTNKKKKGKKRKRPTSAKMLWWIMIWNGFLFCVFFLRFFVVAIVLSDEIMTGIASISFLMCSDKTVTHTHGTRIFSAVIGVISVRHCWQKSSTIDTQKKRILFHFWRKCA